MIYFTDLDRTIIYSKKFTAKDIEEVPIEKYNGEYISFTTNKSIEYIKEIITKHMLIPTTTRTIEQYERIGFNEKGINFTWAIVCNGGHILYKGKPLKIWEDKIKEGLKESFEFSKVRDEFKKYENSKGIIRVKEVENLFFYGILDLEVFNEELLKEFNIYIEKANWNIYISGRKIYFLPNILQKEKAVEFLREYLKYERYCALGDSMMDLNMLKSAHKAYVPKSSYIEELIDDSFFVSKDIGLKGAEEILQVINE